MYLMHMRAMQSADLEAVTAIEQKVQYHPWRYSQFQDSLENHHCSVILMNDQLVGFCIMQPVLDEANLLLMAIDPEYQGQGLGFKILEYSIQGLSEKCVQIFLEVRESNLAAIKLYEKIGFHQIDIRRNYYPAAHQQKENAVIMAYTANMDMFDFKL